MSEQQETNKEPASDGVQSSDLRPPSLTRTFSQEAAPRANKARGTSIGDARWRTLSFSDPGRVILVGVDLSDNSRLAFEYFIRNIHRPDDLIVLTHVPEPPKLPNFSFKEGLKVPSAKWKEILDEANTKTTKLVNDYEDTCIHRKFRYKIRGECHKKPGEMICHIADEEGVDLIVLGCRGSGKFKKAMLGSCSDYIVRNSDRPTLVIPKHD